VLQLFLQVLFRWELALSGKLTSSSAQTTLLFFLLFVLRLVAELFPLCLFIMVVKVASASDDLSVVFLVSGESAMVVSWTDLSEFETRSPSLTAIL